jgi:hypothetical protein
MKGATKHFGQVVLFAALSSLVVGGCSDAPRSPVSPADAVPLFAKSTAVSVKATDPAFGDQGQINEAVTITGSGFKADAQAAWLHNGAVDPTITVDSTRFVNSSTLVAHISIAPNSALDFRDVMVTNFDRTQGIGAAVFEVTQAQIIPGTLAARGANDNGEVTGQLTNGGVFYYDAASGFLQALSTSGSGYAINPLGNAIAAGDVSSSSSPAVLYTRSGPVGSAWSATVLPVDPKANGGGPDAMVTDAVTGQPTLLGGLETFKQAGNCAGSNAIIWSWQASTSTWQRIVLPKNGACQAAIRPRGLSANGIAVGAVNSTAAVWTPNGSGGYTLTLLDGAYANGIDGNASMIAGEKNTSRSAAAAVYWVASGGVWGNAIPFAGGCTSSRDIADASGRVTLNNCPFPGTSVTYASYMDAPYTAPIKLGGVGGHNNNFVGGISASGNYMVGNGFTSGNVQVGVYWKP